MLILFVTTCLPGYFPILLRTEQFGGPWVAQWVKCLPSAQVMISGSWDQALCRALCFAGSLLLLLPLSLPYLPPPCMQSLAHSLK